MVCDAAKMTAVRSSPSNPSQDCDPTGDAPPFTSGGRIGSLFKSRSTDKTRHRTCFGDGDLLVFRAYMESLSTTIYHHSTRSRCSTASRRYTQTQMRDANWPAEVWLVRPPPDQILFYERAAVEAVRCLLTTLELPFITRDLRNAHYISSDGVTPCLVFPNDNLILSGWRCITHYVAFRTGRSLCRKRGDVDAAHTPQIPTNTIPTPATTTKVDCSIDQVSIYTDLIIDGLNRRLQEACWSRDLTLYDDYTRSRCAQAFAFPLSVVVPFTRRRAFWRRFAALKETSMPEPSLEFIDDRHRSEDAPGDCVSALHSSPTLDAIRRTMQALDLRYRATDGPYFLGADRACFSEVDCLAFGHYSAITGARNAATSPDWAELLSCVEQMAGLRALVRDVNRDTLPASPTVDCSRQTIRLSQDEVKAPVVEEDEMVDV